MNIKTLGKRLKEARMNKGYNQTELAEKANISAAYLSDIERGAKMPTIKLFIRIIEALDVSADYIFRHEVSSGRWHVYDEIVQRLDKMTPKQRKGAVDILDAYMYSHGIECNLPPYDEDKEHKTTLICTTPVLPPYDSDFNVKGLVNTRSI